MKLIKCSFCNNDAVNVSPMDMFFGCKNHLQEAHEKTKKELSVIKRIGFNKWLTILQVKPFK